MSAQVAGYGGTPWPKISAPLFVHLTEVGICAMALSASRVDSKVCALNITWGGIKLMWQKAQRDSWNR